MIEAKHTSHSGAISKSGGRLATSTKRLVSLIARLSNDAMRVARDSTNPSRSASGSDRLTYSYSGPDRPECRQPPEALPTRDLARSDAAAVPLGPLQAPLQPQLRTATKWLFHGWRNACRRPGQARFRHPSRVPELTRSTRPVHGSGARAYREGAASLWAPEVDLSYPQVSQGNRSESGRTLQPRCRRRPL